MIQVVTTDSVLVEEGIIVQSLLFEKESSPGIANKLRRDFLSDLEKVTDKVVLIRAIHNR